MHRTYNANIMFSEKNTQEPTSSFTRETERTCENLQKDRKRKEKGYHLTPPSVIVFDERTSRCTSASSRPQLFRF